MKFPKELLPIRKDFINAFSPAWELNDGAHRVEHFDGVALAGLHINRVLGLGYPERMILMVAYLHDLFAWSRENHHMLSQEFVKGTCHPLIGHYTKTAEERILVAKACGEHRASFKGLFSSPFSELMNSADKEHPKSLDSMIQRAMSYHMDRNPGSTFKEARRVSELHMKEKFGRNGYARYPNMYKEAFGKELEEIWKQIDLIPE